MNYTRNTQGGFQASFRFPAEFYARAHMPAPITLLFVTHARGRRGPQLESLLVLIHPVGQPDTASAATCVLTLLKLHSRPAGPSPLDPTHPFFRPNSPKVLPSLAILLATVLLKKPPANEALALLLAVPLDAALQLLLLLHVVIEHGLRNLLLREELHEDVLLYKVGSEYIDALALGASLVDQHKAQLIRHKLDVVGERVAR